MMGCGTDLDLDLELQVYQLYTPQQKTSLLEAGLVRSQKRNVASFLQLRGCFCLFVCCLAPVRVKAFVAVIRPQVFISLIVSMKCGVWEQALAVVLPKTLALGTDATFWTFSPVNCGKTHPQKIVPLGDKKVFHNICLFEPVFFTVIERKTEKSIKGFLLFILHQTEQLKE